jgi:hypothetical protein
MGNPVFANSMEVSSKSMQGKSICEFPDVCFTPPQTPATPTGVPIPYPNTALASDTSDGSRTVSIGGQEIMLRDQSYFKNSSGDEAGSAPKKGIITSTTQGTMYFIGWSMDVLVEGLNVVRNLDMTTHNHASPTGTGSTPTTHVATSTTPAARDKCKLTTYDPNDCPTGTTPHHLVPDSLFKTSGSGGRVPGITLPEGGKGYNQGLCICLTGQDKNATVSDDEIKEMGLDPKDIPEGKDGVRRLNKALLEKTKEAPTGRLAAMFPGWDGASPLAATRGEHGRFHKQFDNIVEDIGASKKPPCTNTTTFGEQRDVAAGLCARNYGCDEQKIKDQLDSHYKKFDVDENTVLRSSDKASMKAVDPSRLGNVPGNPCSAPLMQL